MARNFSHKTILSNFSAHTAATTAADRRARISSPALPSGEWNFLIFITAAPLTSTTTTFLVYGDVQAGRSRGRKDDS